MHGCYRVVSSGKERAQESKRSHAEMNLPTMQNEGSVECLNSIVLHWNLC